MMNMLTASASYSSAMIVVVEVVVANVVQMRSVDFASVGKAWQKFSVLVITQRFCPVFSPFHLSA
jgi:hypothetical protein